MLNNALFDLEYPSGYNNDEIGKYVHIIIGYNPLNILSVSKQLQVILNKKTTKVYTFGTADTKTLQHTGAYLGISTIEKYVESIISIMKANEEPVVIYFTLGSFNYTTNLTNAYIFCIILYKLKSIKNIKIIITGSNAVYKSDSNTNYKIMGNNFNYALSKLIQMLIIFDCLLQLYDFNEDMQMQNKKNIRELLLLNSTNTDNREYFKIEGRTLDNDLQKYNKIYDEAILNIKIFNDSIIKINTGSGKNIGNIISLVNELSIMFTDMQVQSFYGKVVTNLTNLKKKEPGVEVTSEKLLDIMLEEIKSRLPFSMSNMKAAICHLDKL